MGQVIKTDGTVTHVLPAKPPFFTLEELQGFIGGGYIEPVRLPGAMTLLVDEDGLRKELPHNHRASMIAGQPIVGDALLIASDEWE